MRKHPFLFLQALAALLVILVLIEHDNSRNVQAAATQTEYEREASSVLRQLDAIERARAKAWPSITRTSQ